MKFFLKKARCPTCGRPPKPNTYIVIVYLMAIEAGFFIAGFLHGKGII